MKHLLLLLIPSILIGQQQAQVKITNVDPMVFCSGDYVEIAFSYTAPPQKDTTLNTVIWMYRSTILNQGVNLWEGNYNNFHKLKKIGTVDTNYLVKVRMPVDYGPGTATITTLIMQNVYKVPTFNNCTNTTAIDEHKITEGIYYFRPFDPYKTRIEPVKGEILIEQRGAKHRKVRFD